MAKQKQNNIRRDAVRKAMDQDKAFDWQKHFMQSDRLIAAGYVLLFVLITGAVMYMARSEVRYKLGEAINTPIVPRVSFQTIDEEKTRIDQENIRNRTPSIYDLNTTEIESFRKDLEQLPVTIGDAVNPDELDPALREQLPLTKPAIQLLKSYREADNTPSKIWLQKVDLFMKSLEEMPIVSESDYTKDRMQTDNLRIRLNSQWLVSFPTPRDIRDVSELRNMTDIRSYRQQLLRAGRYGNALLEMELAQAITDGFLSNPFPVYIRNDQRTLELKEKAVAGVKNQILVHDPNQVMVPAGTEMDLKQSEWLAKEKQAYFNEMSGHVLFLHGFSYFLICGMLAAGLVALVMAFAPRVVNNPMRGGILLTMLLAAQLIAWLGGSGANIDVDAAAALFTVMMIGIVVAISYNQAFAIGLSVVMGLLIGMTLELHGSIIMVVIGVSVAAVMQIRELRQRGTLIRVGFICGLIAALGMWASGMTFMNLAESGVVTTLIYQSTFCWLASLLVGFLILGLLPYIEKVFNVTTSMTLLELCDVNQPLLQQLAQRAPGTYNHSLNIGMIAEAAADAIDANGLLCRVGAYYHDIGKMNKPDYFIENQQGGENKHDKLKPAMSLLVIVGHVKDGMQMAREAGLPRDLHHFIESHHGTTLVEYFYHAAKKQSEDGQEPEEVEYRYPGPRPQTREAAIMMICDGAESATRSMDQPNARAIEQLVHSILMKRLMDGQFDDCGITLQELSKVEQSIIKSLCGIYHSRIKYPEAESGMDSSSSASGNLQLAGQGKTA